MITSATLNAAGRALFGPAWHGPLAAALGINLRTLQRWAAEKSAPSPEAQAGIARDLVRLLRARGAALEAIRLNLERAPGEALIETVGRRP